MNTEQIALALAIVREKSISKAAESLFLSQPTASIMLKNLEKELGYKLFERTRTGLILTDEGTEFIGYAKIIERSLESVSQIRRPVKRISFKVLSLKNDFFELFFEDSKTFVRLSRLHSCVLRDILGALFFEKYHLSPFFSPRS